MLIIDWSQTVISTVFAMKMEKNIEEDMLRHVILNTIRSFIVKFHEKYDASEIVIAVDSSNSWRKEVFKQYKANRAKNRKDSPVDFKRLFELMDQIRRELQESSHFIVLKVDRAEADDIIAVLAKKNSDCYSSLMSILDCNTHSSFSGTRTLIISTDGDFIQLQKYPGIHQYSPKYKKFLNEKIPEEYLINHIIVGEPKATGDGIPNLLSEDDVFVKGTRQTPLTAKRMQDILPIARELMRVPVLEEKQNYHPVWYDHWLRNRRCIDFDFIPESIENDIVKAFEKEKKEKRSFSKERFLEYLMAKRCRLLIGSIQEFFLQ
jgi:hypothetical protein